MSVARKTPRLSVAPVRRRVPPPEGGPALVSPEARAGGKTSPRPSERQAARTPDPGTGAASPGGTRAAPGRGRAPRTPAGGERGSRAADDRSPLAGSQALSGAEWRKAAARAQRKTTRAASKPPATPALPPAPGSAPLVATASCTACGQIAGPGPMGDVDRVAVKHTGVGHSTGVSAELGGAA